MVIEQFAELLHGRVVDDAHDRTMLALSVQRETTEREIETLTETKTTLQAAVDTLRAAAAKGIDSDAANGNSSAYRALPYWHRFLTAPRRPVGAFDHNE